MSAIPVDPVKCGAETIASKWKRPPTEADLLRAGRVRLSGRDDDPIGVLRHPDPVSGQPEPALFVEWADRAFRLLSALVSLLAEPIGVVGHSHTWPP